MKRRLKFLFITAAVLVALCAAGSFALNRWLQSPETHARLEREIGEAMRMPLKLGKITLSLWSGLVVEGITVPAGDGNFFEAAALSADPKFTSLLRGRIALGEVRIVRPRIRLFESADGQWRLPEFPKAAEAPVATAVAPAAPATPPAAPGVPVSSAPPKPKKHIELLIRKIVIADGSAEMIDKQKLPFASVSGLNATFKDVSEKSAAGEIDIAGVTLPGYAVLDHIKANIDRNGEDFAVRNLAVNVCGGRVLGDFTRTAGSPASTHLVLDNVNIGLLGKEARAHIRNASGVVSGEARFAGIDGDRKAMTGNGTITLKSGRCTEIELVRQLGEVLRVAAIAGFEVREATANFQIASERVQLTPMDISSHPLGMSLSGGIGFDGAVELVGILRAPADFIAKAGLIAAQFSPPDSNGQRGVQFDIKGTLDKPRQNLAEKLTGTTDRKTQRIIAAESVLSTILEKTNIGKKNPKLMKLLPEILNVRPAPQPAPAPQQ